MDAFYTHWPPFLQKYFKNRLQKTDAIIAVSKKWGEQLKEIAPSARVAVFSNCIPQQAAVSRAENKPGSPVRALFIGSVGKRKGAFDLICAASLLAERDCSFSTWIVGYEESPGQMDAARTCVRDLHLDGMCELTGALQGSEKQARLDQADIFVLPSYNEGLPMAVLEALSAGLPVISTPVGGIPEVVREGENGFLIHPGDIAGLADRLETLIENPVLRLKMGERSREICRSEFNPQTYVRRLVLLYSSLSQARSRAGILQPDDSYR
jgi:glycosyltransferase involved in cell wall biosynthesis